MTGWFQTVIYWIFDSVMLTVTCKRSDDDKIHLFASSAK